MDKRIPIPDGFKPPEDVKDGQEFQQLVTFRLDGKYLQLCAIGNIEVDDDDYETAIKKGFNKMKGQSDEPS